MLIIHLIRHKWDSEDPFPGFAAPYTRMGIYQTSARAHARSLEKKGYLVRTMRVGTTNKFELGKLFTALGKLHAYELGKKVGTKSRKDHVLV